MTRTRPLRAFGFVPTSGCNESINGRNPEFWPNGRLTIEATTSPYPFRSFGWQYMALPRSEKPPCALTAILDAWFATKDRAAWSAILMKTGIAFGVVATLDDVPHDVQMRASGALVPVDDPRADACRPG